VVLGPLEITCYYRVRDTWLNGGRPPVLKHGPGSFTGMQVEECQTRRRNESKEQFLLEVVNYIVSPPPGLLLARRFEVEHVGKDPKDGELYVSRMKPGETLVEVRRGTDVQIVRPTCV
jgi:hypothetical protein